MKGNNTFRKLSGLVLAGMMSMSVASAETMDLTLEESVRLALDNNYSIKEQEAAYDSAVWARHQARRTAGPKLNWESKATKLGGHYYDTVNLDRAFGNGLTLTFPVYTGGQLEGAIKAADLGLNASEPGLELCRAIGRRKRGAVAELAVRLERKKLDREGLAAMLERSRQAFAAALLLLYGKKPEENDREIAPFLAKNLTKAQIMSTIELLETYYGECAYNVGVGHVLGALAAELEGIL